MPELVLFKPGLSGTKSEVVSDGESAAIRRLVLDVGVEGTSCGAALRILGDVMGISVSFVDIATSI